jgi:hypothetical protein
VEAGVVKIGLMALSGVRVRNRELVELGVTLPQFVNRGKVVASLPSLGLLTVAALTPDDVEVAYREVPELPGDGDLEPFDLVGISSFSAQIGEAYALADRYRAAGIPVVLGGLHVSLMPDEAAGHADSIVINGAEGAWPTSSFAIRSMPNRGSTCSAAFPTTGSPCKRRAVVR